MRYYLGAATYIKTQKTVNLPLMVQSESASPAPSAVAPFHPKIIIRPSAPSANAASTSTGTNLLSTTGTSTGSSGSTPVDSSTATDIAASNPDLTTPSATAANADALATGAAKSTGLPKSVIIGGALVAAYLLFK